LWAFNKYLLIDLMNHFFSTCTQKEIAAATWRKKENSPYLKQCRQFTKVPYSKGHKYEEKIVKNKVAFCK
jgi:hypothetical protein